MIPFTHLHVHSQYSILDGAASIEGIIKKAKDDGMTAVALTDHGAMFGNIDFYKKAVSNQIKPILGIEAYVARNNRKSKDKNDKRDRSGYHLILLAKNETGYKNLIKLCSLSYIEGFYYKPRIDREILEKFSEGLIVTSACLGGEISQKIMAGDEKGLDETIQWYKSIFKEDYYLEMMRHPSGNAEMDRNVYENQEKCVQKILDLSKKHGVKIIATNDSHFLNAEDADAHDILVCLNTGKDYDDPNRLKYTRQEFFKTQEEMNKLFADIPEALINTQEITEKVEKFKLSNKPVMPDFPLPDNFNDANEYLRHIAYEGAKERWGQKLSEKVKERLDFELDTIKRMGYPGYFLIVWDFIKAARKMNVIVGPGRGSAAGSAVAYCTNITNIDPIKHELLFERFLNPDRISLPDMDIDFDDDGRQMVLDWVTDKYGEDKVSHIITFGSMAAKLAIRDVGRVLKLPLAEADRLAKLVPEIPGITLKKAYKEVPALAKEKQSQNSLVQKTLKYAEELEGSIRHTGIHACGIIIGKEPLIEHIPIMPVKDSHLLATQYEGTLVEFVGMLKMDFLGLKTLSIIRDTLKNIKYSNKKIINIEEISFNDKPTYNLFSKGETVGVFQFESDGMRKHLKNLKPNRFEDLVAMNALYRPGPMEYIPSFIKRKHGKEVIEYDHPIMEKFLSETYGVTVYQEQVMLLSRELAGFTRGESDTLRKAMGKKIKKTMDNMKEKFIEGCLKNEEFIKGCKETVRQPKALIEKIWHDWEAFAKYAFNKSHAASYAYLAYYTAYLKTKYPAEFMAAALSRNLNIISDVTKLLDECKSMNIKVFEPDVNESFTNFTINPEGNIRFGLAAIKGVGQKAVDTIIREREKNGKFKDIYDFFERINLSNTTKTTFESTAMAGGFDSFGYKRSQFFETSGDKNIIENLISYGQKIQNENGSMQPSLFGGANEISIRKPEIPDCPEWSKIERLNKEKELIGVYLSAHPLDEFALEFENFCTVSLSELSKKIENFEGRNITVGGYVTNVKKSTTKKGNPYGVMTIEDFSDSFELALFSKDYLKFGNFFIEGLSVLIKGNVQKKGWGDTPNVLEFKVTEFLLLSEAREKLIKQLQLVIDLDNLTEELISEIYERTVKNQGKITLRFKVRDRVNNLKISMFSRKIKINIDESFFKFLKENPDIEYSFN